MFYSSNEKYGDGSKLRGHVRKNLRTQNLYLNSTCLFLSVVIIVIIIIIIIIIINTCCAFSVYVSATYNILDYILLNMLNTV
jgi:hypothetical protein